VQGAARGRLLGRLESRPGDVMGKDRERARVGGRAGRGRRKVGSGGSHTQERGGEEASRGGGGWLGS
jgi:hypothetical protein